ncbi:cell envelope integrity protein TolA [Serratia plymuthica]|uniref:cell envelope integrity protein TolA n=1 Tax=Serratia plymuthica TaxID=82996 RepID=UPI0018D9CCB0|nr:cell envelope integrity protein TolA [Serratia plymuthica]QPS88207.1 cell envelope integrity protein TolA [Serratia plymuthica]
MRYLFFTFGLVTCSVFSSEKPLIQLIQDERNHIEIFEKSIDYTIGDVKNKYVATGRKASMLCLGLSDGDIYVNAARDDDQLIVAVDEVRYQHDFVETQQKTLAHGVICNALNGQALITYQYNPIEALHAYAGTAKSSVNSGKAQAAAAKKEAAAAAAKKEAAETKRMATAQDSAKIARASGEDISRYQSAFQSAIGANLNTALLDRYKGKVCTIKLSVARDGKLLNVTSQGGDPDFCGQLITRIRSARIPVPPNDETWNVFKNASVDIKGNI